MPLAEYGFNFAFRLRQDPILHAALRPSKLDRTCRPKFAAECCQTPLSVCKNSPLPVETQSTRDSDAQTCI